jgi:hypothetical protein
MVTSLPQTGHTGYPQADCTFFTVGIARFLPLQPAPATLTLCHNTHAHSARARRGNATNPITASHMSLIMMPPPPYGAIQRTWPSLSLTITAEPPG